MAMTAEIEFPRAFSGLFTATRYKVLYGGRGSGKSWSAAGALLAQGMREPLRVLCAREIMRTIGDSVHRLLTDRIDAVPAFKAFYEHNDSTIKGANGAEFLYAGLREMDASKIKSFEGVDICWVEEAQSVRAKSWNVLVPTIRADGSEIWVTFNPELDSDATYQRFVVKPPAGAWVQKVSYRDNPWFPSVLEDERKALQIQDAEEYSHVWEGECRTVVAGAIYGREVLQMIESGRICRVPYNPQLPVHTVWDLGWNDQTSIILLQRSRHEISIIEYLEDSFVTTAEWVAELEKRKYVWGHDYLPHDGRQTSRQTGKSDEMVLKGLGRKPKIVPRGDVEEGIRAARMVIPRVYIDQDKAERLVECLKKYRRSIPTTTGEPATPVHDQYSHGADAFRGLAMVVDKIRNEADQLQIFVPPRVMQNSRVGY
jgi:phage terminase large subunit